MPAPLPVLSSAELSRYSRHLLLEEVGLAGQQRLAAARVLVVGAGGLGSPAALYLAAAGIGTLGIADLDQVETHNLQRQLLHDSAAVGQAKVSSAAARLRAINPHIRVVEHPEGVTEENASTLFADYDIVVDGTDNFSARYINNDAAVATRRPLVFGSVFKFEGQVSVFAPHLGGPCYRCLFPVPPAPGSVPACGEAGVLGAVCGVIGSLQAVEVLKLITGAGQPLIGRLLTYDALTQTFSHLSLPRDSACPTCRRPDDQTPPPPEPPPAMSEPTYPLEISVAEAKSLLEQPGSGAMLIDVRESWETDLCRVASAELIPMRTIPERVCDLPKDRHLLIMCHHGGRSFNVTRYLRANGFAAVTNIEGGIDAWAAAIDPSLARY